MSDLDAIARGGLAKHGRWHDRGEASGKRELANWRAIVDADLADVRQSLGDAPFTAAWAEGHALRLDEALAYGLETPRPV